MAERRPKPLDSIGPVYSDGYLANALARMVKGTSCPGEPPDARGVNPWLPDGLRLSLPGPVAVARPLLSREVARDDQTGEERLRAAWERLTEPEREAIRAAVKAEKPGVSRWKNLLEADCLAELGRRLEAGEGSGHDPG
jgi:hypothetical protein